MRAEDIFKGIHDRETIYRNVRRNLATLRAADSEGRPTEEIMNDFMESVKTFNSKYYPHIIVRYDDNGKVYIR